MTVLSGPRQITCGGGICFVYVYSFPTGKTWVPLVQYLTILQAETLAFSSDIEKNLFSNLCIVKSFTYNESFCLYTGSF